jgi:hypothetical protein
MSLKHCELPLAAGFWPLAPIRVDCLSLPAKVFVDTENYLLVYRSDKILSVRSQKPVASSQYHQLGEGNAPIQLLG